MIGDGRSCAWSRQRRFAAWAEVCRVPFLVSVACVTAALQTGCRSRDVICEPVTTHAPVKSSQEKHPGVGIEEMMAPVRIGMSEAELREAGCVTEHASGYQLGLMTTPSQLDPGLEVRTAKGSAAAVALGGEDRRVKIFRTYDRSFVVYGCIHVGTTYRELLARLAELGVRCSEPVYCGPMGAMVMPQAEPRLRFYFARTESDQPRACTTEPYTRGDIEAMRNARMADMRKSLNETAEAGNREELSADARIQYIDVGRPAQVHAAPVQNVDRPANR